MTRCILHETCWLNGWGSEPRNVSCRNVYNLRGICAPQFYARLPSLRPRADPPPALPAHSQHTSCCTPSQDAFDPQIHLSPSLLGRPSWSSRFAVCAHSCHLEVGDGKVGNRVYACDGVEEWTMCKPAPEKVFFRVAAAKVGKLIPTACADICCLSLLSYFKQQYTEVHDEGHLASRS